MDEIQPRQHGALGLGKPALGTDQDRPWPGRKAGKRLGRTGNRLIRPQDPPRAIPARQDRRQRLQRRHLRDMGAAALFSRLDRMGLKPVLADPLGIGEISLDRQDPRRAQFGRLFDNEIGPRLLDRREYQPEIGRIALFARLRGNRQLAAALSRLIQKRRPFAIAPVEHNNAVAHPQPHDARQVMRLCRIKRNGLSRQQRVIYEQSDPGHDGRNAMQYQTERPDAVVDAPAGNWVDRHASAAARPWLRLSRADRPIGTWLLLLPCWWGVGLAMMVDQPHLRDLWIVVACAIGAFVMRGAGCTWNDITDRDFDAQVARTRSRPLPSGQITLRGAYLWLMAQLLVGLVILLTLGQAAIWMGVASLALVAIYPFAKRFTWWPQFFLGLAFNWGILLAYAAHMGRVDMVAIVAWLGGIAWTIFYDTIYAHQDTEDDALIGVRSTALLFGDQSPRILMAFALLAVMLLGAAIALTGRNQLIAGIGLAGFAAHLIWQLRVFKPDQPDNCLRLFRSNRNAGLILAVFLALAGAS